MSESNAEKFNLIDLPDLPDSVDNALKNLTDSPTKSIGKTLDDMWYMVFGGLSFAADKKRMKYAAQLQQYRKELGESIDRIPEDKKVDPTFQVTASALENSKYCVTSEILREMFTNLISSSMNSDTVSLAHPAFPEILKQLSPQDALLLQDIFFSKKDSLPIASMGIQTQNRGYNILYENVFLAPSLDLAENLISLSLDSLHRVNLITIDYSKHLFEIDAYELLKETVEYKAMQEIISTIPNSTPYFKKGIVKLTSFGQSFCTTCIKQN